jgi:hypothetical protein
MKTIITLLFLCFSLTLTAQNDKFRLDYDLVAFNFLDGENWTDYKQGTNIFIVNINSNGDILHIRADQQKVIYTRLSKDIEQGESSGEPYQWVEYLDEEGNIFIFQLFNNPQIGLKFIYTDYIIQFAKQ